MADSQGEIVRVKADMYDYKVSFFDSEFDSKERVVLIVEDHEIVRSGMKSVINGVLNDCWVDVLEADTIENARRIVEEHQGGLDLIVLDVYLPDASGAALVALLKTEWISLPVVVVSACDDWHLAADFLRAGALGFIPKGSNVSVITNALSLIFAGGRYFPPQVFELLSEPTVDQPPEKLEIKDIEGTSKPPIHSAELSPRQRDVLNLMLQGLSNKEIAKELGVSVGTAKNYVAVVLRAYNANTRARAVLAALNEGAEYGSE